MIMIISFFGQYSCVFIYIYILVDIQPHNVAFEYDTIASENKYRCCCEHLIDKDKQYRHGYRSDDVSKKTAPLPFPYT